MKMSIKQVARIGGVFYLLIIVAGLMGEFFVRAKLIVSGDAAATTNNIESSSLLWRFGIAGDLFMHVCDIPLVLIFYILLKPVSKNLALLAMLFVLTQTAVLIASKLILFMPLFLASDVGYLKVFAPDQLHALSYLAIRLDAYGFGVGLIFFGFSCLILGHLISRSGYLPKLIGILMQIAGACYLVNSVTLILAPAIADILFPVILLPSFIGELSFCLWLLVKGVDVSKWHEKTHALAHL
jgi:hypothetical protein